jgi:hypothetical protein
MSKVSFNYTDEHGLSYITLKQGLERVFGRLGRIEVEYELRKLDIKGEGAVAELDVRVIASYEKDRGYVLGDAARPERLIFSLDKERTKWLVTRTEGFKVGL